MGIFLLSNALLSATVRVTAIGVLSRVAGIGLVLFAFQVCGAARAV
jgi:uncharacterized membrane protein HdeD (DUF308 family)